MKREQGGVPVPQSVVARIAQGIRYVATGSAPAAWFGPLEPMAPLAPPEVAGRQFDYPSGFNLNVQPRAYEAISFADLRALADGYDLMRLVIETRKDQLVKCAWTIQPRDRKQNTDGDRRLSQMTDLLAYPDREHGWDAWLRMLVEDMLVIDAATLYPRRARGGALYALEPIDGATIKRVLDDQGRTPLPPSPAYQQVLKGLPAVDYTAEEILYLPRNVRANRVYGLSPVEQVIMTVNIALRRQIHQLQYYTEGNIPEALIGVPVGWGPDQIAAFQAYWDSLNEGNTAQRRHARFVPETISKSYVQTKEAALKDETDEWLARILCYAFSVSNQPFIKQMSRAESQTSSDTAMREGLAPLKAWTKGIIDRVLTQVMGYKDLEFAWEEEQDIDPLQQAQIDKVYLSAGVTTINEVRAARGWERIADGDVPLIEMPAAVVRLCDAVKDPAETAPASGAAGAEDPAASADEVESAPEGAPEKPLAKSAGSRPEDRVDAARRGKLEGIWLATFRRQARRAAAAVGTLRLAKADDGTADGAPPKGAKPTAPPIDRDAAEAAGAALGVGGGAEEGGDETAADPAVEAVVEDAVPDDASVDAAEASRQMIEAEAIGGAEGGMEEAGVAVDATSLANPAAIAWAEAHAAELVSGINRTTRAALRRLIVQAETEGGSVRDLQKKIEQDYAFSAERAELIARHELATASIRGALIGWRRARDEYGADIAKRWIEYGALEHCPACNENARAGAIPLEAEFPSGAWCAPGHPNCRCDTVAEVRRKADMSLGSAPLAKGFDPDEPRDDHGRWEMEIAKGQAAMKKAISGRRDVNDAMEMSDVGRVSFVWGEPGDPEHDFRGGYGVSHILAKRAAKKRDGVAVAMKIPEVLTRGERHLSSPNRMVFHHDGHRALLTHGGNGPENAWVLTGYEDDEPRSAR